MVCCVKFHSKLNGTGKGVVETSGLTIEFIFVEFTSFCLPCVECMTAMATNAIYSYFVLRLTHHDASIKRMAHAIIHFNSAADYCSACNAQHGPYSVMLDRIMSFPHGSRILCWYKHCHKMRGNCDECECQWKRLVDAVWWKSKTKRVLHKTKTLDSISSPLCRVDALRVLKRWSKMAHRKRYSREL